MGTYYTIESYPGGTPKLSSDGKFAILEQRYGSTNLQYINLVTQFELWNYDFGTSKAQSAINSNGQLIAVLQKSEVIQILGSDCKEIARLSKPWPKNDLHSQMLCFSPDSQWFACQMEADKIDLYQLDLVHLLSATSSIWLEQPTIQLSLKLQTQIKSFAFSEDSQVVVAGCSNGAVVLWELNQ